MQDQAGIKVVKVHDGQEDHKGDAHPGPGPGLFAVGLLLRRHGVLRGGGRGNLLLGLPLIRFVLLVHLLFLGNDFQAAQILLEHLGDLHGAVLELVLLHHGGEDSAGGQAGAVEGVDELRLAALPAEAVTVDGVRCAVRVYERYSIMGSNRVSLNVTLMGRDGELYLSAITSGGSQATFFKLNTIGEEAFLGKLDAVVRDLAY